MKHIMGRRITYNCKSGQDEHRFLCSLYHNSCAWFLRILRTKFSQDEHRFLCSLYHNSCAWFLRILRTKFSQDEHRFLCSLYHTLMLILPLLMICNIWSAGNAPVASAETNSVSLPKDIQITDPATGVSYTQNITTNPTVTYNDKKISKEHYPLVYYNYTWMADAQSFFSGVMDFDFKYSEEGITSVQQIQNFTLRSPRLDTTIVFTVGKDTVMVNGEERIVPYPVMWGSDVNSKNSENTAKPEDEATLENAVLLIPVVWTLQEAGYMVTSTESAVTISDSMLYYQNKYDDSYDSNIYTNRLEGIYVAKKSSTAANFFRLNTENTLASKSVKITDKPKKATLTLTLSKTKNSLGNITKTFSGGIIKKLQIQENSNHATVITLWYSAAHIYTKQYDTKSLSIQFSASGYSMLVLLPDKVNTKKIKTTDQYWKNRFLIVIPGNHVDYYKKNPPLKNSSGIKSIKITKTAQKNTKITVTTKKLRGYRITYSDNGYFTVKIGSLKSIYKNIVLLDAGHGGKDNGARKNGCKEKKLNLSIIYTRAKKLFEAQDSTVKAYWTRYNDTLINLYQRPKYSKKYSADLFVSLHMNSAPSRAASGTEVYYSRQNNKANKSGLTSKIVANRLLSALTYDLGMKDRGVRSANFVVIKYNTVPAVLVELGFISNPVDSRKIKKASFQNKTAKTLYKEISDIFKDYPTGR